MLATAPTSAIRGDRDPAAREDRCAGVEIRRLDERVRRWEKAVAVKRPRAKAAPWALLSVWVVVLAGLTVLGLGIDGRLAPVSLSVPGTSSSRAQELLEQRFGESVPVTVLLEGPRAEIDRQGRLLVSAFRRADDVTVLSPWESAEERGILRPRPQAALVVVSFQRSEEEAATKVLPASRRVVERTIEAPVRSHMSGLAVIGEAIEEQSLAATHRAELIALPVLLFVLLLVFRSPVAALVPLLIGAATVLAGRGLLLAATFVAPITSLGVAIASMMGLALGVDYALLMVSRLRQERDRGADMETSLATASRVAGRTIVFAGGTLALAMAAATVVVSGPLLSSVAIGVVVSGLLSVVLAVSLMPALLAVMGGTLERWRLPPLGHGGGVLGASGRLIARPGVAVPLILVALVAIAVPAGALELGPPDVHQLPRSDPTRQSFEAIERAIGPGWTAPFTVVASARDGVIGEPRRLRAMARWQDRVARSPDVAAVIGPASLRPAERGVREAKAEYQAAPGALAEARSGIEDLRLGLADARAGVAELRAGLATGADGGERLGVSARRARAGAARLVRGLERAAAGSRRLAHGIDRSAASAGRLANGNRRVAEGADELARGIARLDAGLRTTLGPVSSLADRLRSWAGWLQALRAPTELAATELGRALGLLEVLAAGSDDPLPPELRRAIETAYAAITGIAPGGATLPVPPPIAGERGLADAPSIDAVRGIAPVLLAMDAELETTAEQLADLPSSLDRLTDDLDLLAAGADELESGARASERGATGLKAGLSRLSRGAHRLDRAIRRTRDGSGRLEDGLAPLAAGADDLAAGLRAGDTRASALEDGIGESEQPLSDYAVALRGYERDYRRIDTQSPGAIDSGYLLLTALDGTPPRTREQIGQIVNVDRGGQAARILVVPKAAPSTPSTERLGHHLQEQLPALARASGTDVEVGEGAQSLADYTAATRSRLPWLMLALSVVATLTLVLVVRSLVLPPIAVALTLLTVGAAFGGLELLFRLGVLHEPRYVDAISAAGILAIMFVLAIDYLVFLLTRMREGWLATHDHLHAIRYGIENTAGVITGAAAIMAAVFLAFASADVASLRQFGAGLTIAVVIDATVVRLVLLPAIMRGLGPRAWWMPRWLDERLPNFEHAEPAPVSDLTLSIEPAPAPARAPATALPVAAPRPPVDELAAVAHAEHDDLLGLLVDIEVAGAARDGANVARHVRELRTTAEPHFEYEQRSLFPQLVDVLGADYVETLYADQEGLVAALARIETIVAAAEIDSAGAAEIGRLVRAAAEAIVNCDGLTAVVARQGDEVAARVLAARERAVSNIAHPNLRRWNDHRGSVRATRPRRQD